MKLTILQESKELTEQLLDEIFNIDDEEVSSYIPQLNNLLDRLNDLIEEGEN